MTKKLDVMFENVNRPFVDFYEKTFVRGGVTFVLLKDGREAIERLVPQRDPRTGEEMFNDKGEMIMDVMLRELPPALRNLDIFGREVLDPQPLTVTVDMPMDHIRSMLSTGRLPAGRFDQPDLGEGDYDDLHDGSDFGITAHEAPFMPGFEEFSKPPTLKSSEQSTASVDKKPSSAAPQQLAEEEGDETQQVS